MNYANKNILITGGGRGIGFELAKLYSQKKANVAICGRCEETLSKAASSLTRETITISADLSNDDAPLQIAQRVEESLGGLDLLINNAAIQLNYSLFDRPYSELKQDIELETDTNFTSVVKLTAACLPMLTQSKQGSIVNLSSGLAFAPKESAPVYCASKAALSNFSRTLRYQAESHAPHLTVTDVVLPIVDTDMTAGRGTGKIASSAAAKQIYKGVKSGREVVPVGKARMMDFMMRVSPNTVHKMLRSS